MRRLPAKTKAAIFTHASKLRVKIAKPPMEYDPNGGEMENKTWAWMNRIQPCLTVVGECHEWNGANSKGYGQIRLFVAGEKRIFSTHRIAIEVRQRELIPEGLSALHRCDNPKCNNPDHLFTGDMAANVHDMHSKKRARGMFVKGQIPHANLARGERSGNAVMTDESVTRARVIYDAGLLGYKLLAKMFGTAPAGMRRIVIRKGWLHVPTATTELRDAILLEYLQTHPATPKRTGKSISI